ncbi:MAG TPA: galactokinase family protein [Methylomirabilota bacterium]|nr:galactokinase family protein [Methylomirabilota bacterium]
MEPPVRTLFKKHFAHAPPHVVPAPGRLELLGNHTDYNEGLVMAIAVDKYVHLAAAARNDGKVKLVAAAFPEPEEFFVSDLKRNPGAPWADYVKGVIDQLHRRGARVGGFNAAIDGTIPMGAGMSSSAALEVATALVIRRMYPFALRDGALVEPPKPDEHNELPPLGAKEKMDLAKLCQAAENEFVGVKCGLLDQASSLLGKAHHAIELDFRFLTVEYAPMFGDIAIVTCNSGVKHQLVGGEYNELRALCESAAKKLGAKFLRSVDPKDLTAHRRKLTEREYQCAYHVVGEIQRVVHGARALRDNDFAQFGQFMFQSHESSRDYFKNSTRELDLLVAIAREHPACLGARLTGGGFGGATINLVQRDDLDAFRQFMSLEYKQWSGIEMVPLLCQIVDGAA